MKSLKVAIIAFCVVALLMFGVCLLVDDTNVKQVTAIDILCVISCVYIITNSYQQKKQDDCIRNLLDLITLVTQNFGRRVTYLENKTFENNNLEPGKNDES